MGRQIQGKGKREEAAGEEGEQGREEETGQAQGEEKKRKAGGDRGVNARGKGINKRWAG